MNQKITEMSKAASEKARSKEVFAGVAHSLAYHANQIAAQLQGSSAFRNNGSKHIDEKLRESRELVATAAQLLTRAAARALIVEKEYTKERYSLLMEAESFVIAGLVEEISKEDEGK